MSKWSRWKSKIVSIGAVAAAAATTLGIHTPWKVMASGEQSIGLSLFFQNSQMPVINLVGNHPRYLSEVDITATTPPSAVDAGIQPLITSSEFSVLDWTGVQMVEEKWAPPGNGTYTRQRFYRGAAWMEQPSVFLVFPEDNRGHSSRRSAVRRRRVR